MLSAISVKSVIVSVLVLILVIAHCPSHRDGSVQAAMKSTLVGTTDFQYGCPKVKTLLDLQLDLSNISSYKTHRRMCFIVFLYTT